MKWKINGNKWNLMEIRLGRLMKIDERRQLLAIILLKLIKSNGI